MQIFLRKAKYKEFTYFQWRQTALKSGGAEWKFETYLVKFETYSVIRDYETKKTAGAPEPPEPPSLAPMLISQTQNQKTSFEAGL